MDFAPFQAIGVIQAPVVLVTSSAIVANGVLSLYGSVNDRMRAMVGELLELLGPDLAPPQGPRSNERLDELDRQLTRLLRRHRVLRDAVLLTYMAIVILMASMFLVAVAVTATWAWAASAALWVLLAGTVVLVGGLVQTVRAVHSSNDAVDAEVRRVLSLGGRDGRSARNTTGPDLRSS